MSNQLTRRNAVPDLRAHFRELEATIANGNGMPLAADDVNMQNQIRDMGSSLMNSLGLEDDAYMSDGTVATCGSEAPRDVLFTDIASRANSPVYPLSACNEDFVLHKNPRNDDDDTPPPPYITRTAEAVRHDIYRPPALRTDAKPDTSFVDMPTVREAFNGLDFAARNMQRTVNVITKLDRDDQLALVRLLAAICPRNVVTFRIDPIAAVISAWPKYMGIDYEVRFNNGRTARIRDVDAWRSPNGRIMIALFWGNKNRVMAIEDINKLLLLPQYSAEGGFFLQAMKAELLKGTVQAPRIGKAIF